MSGVTRAMGVMRSAAARMSSRVTDVVGAVVSVIAADRHPLVKNESSENDHWRRDMPSRKIRVYNAREGCR